MTRVFDQQNRMITLSNGTELQEWKVERLSDDSVEYHMYMGHNYSKPPGESLAATFSKGAIWMLFRVTLPDVNDADQTTEYRMGRTGLPGSGNDTADAEWTARAAGPFFRFDQVMREFFS